MGNPHRDRRRRRGNDDNFGNRMEDVFARYGKIDVSIDGRGDNPYRGDSQYRDNRGGGGGHGGYRNDRRDNNGRPPRPRLEFTELICLEQGDCRCRITAADGQVGKIYNFSVERQNRDRTSRFFRETDANDLAIIVKRAADYIASQKNS